MIDLAMYPERVARELLEQSYEVERNGREYLLVAWGHTDGGWAVRTTARHLLDPDRYLTTLCGRRFRISKLVIPNEYWTDSNCERCFRSAA